MIDTSEIEANETDSPLIIAPMEPQPDYFSDLKAYILSIVANGIEPLPDPIVEDLVPYLRSLTEELSPPPPELLDRILDHFSESVEDRDEFETIRAHFFDTVMHEAIPVDRTPLSFDGIEDLIQKITVRGDTSSAAAKLAVLFATLFIRLRFRMPGNVRRHFARRGPFEVVQLDEAIIPASVPLSQAYNFDPRDPNKVISSKTVAVRDIMVPNRKVDVVTSDLIGFTSLITVGQYSPTLSDGTDSVTVHPVSSDRRPLATSVHSNVEYDPLRRPWCSYGVNFHAPYWFDHRDQMKGLFLSVVAHINLKHYSGIF